MIAKLPAPIRSNIESIGTFIDIITPLIVRIYGANINRKCYQ